MDYVQTTLRHDHVWGDALARGMFESIAKLPGGKEWAERNRGELEREDLFIGLESPKEKSVENEGRIYNALTNSGINPKMD